MVRLDPCISGGMLPMIVPFLAAMVMPGGEAAASRPAIVKVKAKKAIGTVNKMVFGNNILAYLYSDAKRHRDGRYSDRGAGIWDPEDACPVPEYVQLARLAGIAVARWPGGCGTHHYNWKRTVGPVSQRPRQRFGLSEFLVWCRAVGAEPLITIADYWGNHNDAADLVEYLNAPAGANPNGGRDWAAVRAAQGFPEPWGVKWFEYGNETWHGDHLGKHKMTGEEYARRFLLYHQAMKAVDPAVKLGALVQDTGDWARTVVRIAGRYMDFAVTHTYIPGAWRDEIKKWTPRQVAEACLAADLQIRRRYEELRQMIAEECGRRDVPIAVTEYNAGFVQEKPVPYRQCLATAVRNADHIRVMLDPSLHILMANFWQFSNEYWGMVRGYVHKGERPVKQANFFVYQLYSQHFGGVLLQAEVDCARWDFSGACRVAERRGQGSQYKLYPENLYEGQPWRVTHVPDVEHHLEDGGRVVVAQFKGTRFNYYHASITIPAEPSTGYHVVGWIKTEDLRASRGAGFQIGDARGWLATRSAIVPGDVRGTTEGWVKVEGDYITLPDTTAIQVVARRLDVGDECSGKAWYKLESVQKFQPEVLPAVPYLEAMASLRKRDGAICLMLIHKDLDAPTPTSISLDGARPRTARAWALVGPAPDATNLGPHRPIRIRQLPCRVQGSTVSLILPPCSVVAVEVLTN